MIQYRAAKFRFRGVRNLPYDIMSVNFFPVIGMLYMMIFMWKNDSMDRSIVKRFYVLSALICVELLIYNMELFLMKPEANVILLTLATAIGYSVRPFLLCIFVYIVMRNEHRLKVRIPLMMPALVNVVFAFSTFLTHATYYYTPDHVLHRGPLGWTTHLVMAIYLVILLVLIFAPSGKHNNFEKIIIIEIVLMLLIATIAESILGNIYVLRIAMASSLIFYYMFFQTQIYKEELVSKHEQQNELTEKFSLQIITALASTVDAKDSYTNGHSQRVAIYSREIARRLGKSEEFQRDIYYMGLLHDIGKIGIPDQIINKTGRLTDEEFAAIKSHTVIGADVLIRITEMPNLYIGAMWHHERYDGRGYPDGLKGDEIPVYARIIAVADTYDAMTSQRSYRAAMSQQKVKEELERAKRTQLDPFLANIMLDMIAEDKNYEMRERKDESLLPAAVPKGTEEAPRSVADEHPKPPPPEKVVIVPDGDSVSDGKNEAIEAIHQVREYEEQMKNYQPPPPEPEKKARKPFASKPFGNKKQ